jgi:hypothetical protein
VLKMAKIGERVMAVLSSTPEEVKLLGEGVYEGDHPVDVEGMGGFPNPRIRLDDGTVIWGFQCWWGDIGSMKSWIGSRRVVKVGL